MEVAQSSNHQQEEDESEVETEEDRWGRAGRRAGRSGVEGLMKEQQRRSLAGQEALAQTALAARGEV